MSTTVFCTFEHQDLADLAVGKLRDLVSGVRSIHYIREYRPSTDILNRSGATNMWSGIVDAALPRPVTVKIVCSDSAAPAVKARLINMHAYRIITTR